MRTPVLVAMTLTLLVATARTWAIATITSVTSADSSATPIDSVGYRYEYTINNDSETGGYPIVAWAIPFFNDAATSFLGGDESSIVAPEGWGHAFVDLTAVGDDDDDLAIDPGLDWEYSVADDPKSDTYAAPGSEFNNPPFALVFFTLADVEIDFNTLIGTVTYPYGIDPGEFLGGFGFDSPFTGGSIPFVASFADVPHVGSILDPLGLVAPLEIVIGDPLGPLTPDFPVRQVNGEIPEPMSAALGAMAFAATVLALRRRSPNCPV